MPAIDDLAQTATAPAATTQPTEATARPQQSLGRYQIERLIGAGGMGVVYSAFDPELERRVALKVLPDSRRGKAARERLLREARAMARVTHPNVVRVYEVDSVDGHDFVAMELVDGGNLDEWLRTKRSPDAVLAAFVAAGRGLAAAHAAGIIHRDFKPHNVLCATDGRILVTDFGLARGIDDAASQSDPHLSPPSRPSSLSGLTETGSVLGTPAYMAPEQRSGDSVGPAADQFAFCVALWEAFAGARPYRGKLDDMLAALERGPSALDASVVPRPVRAPLLRGLEPDPDKRWPTMGALLEQIAPRTRRWLIPALAAASVAVAIAIVIVGNRGGAPACPIPTIDPAAAWPVGAREILFAQNQKPAAVLMQHDIEKWHELRDQACQAEPAIREPRLTCLDAVLTRFDAVAAGARATPTPRIDPGHLIDPAVCMQSPVPRIVPASPEYRATMARLIYWSGTEVVATDAAFDELRAIAKADPCAQVLAYMLGTSTAATTMVKLERLDRAQTVADQCSDDHAIALLALQASMIELSVHGRGASAKAKTERAEIAVRRIPLPNFRAQLEINAATEVAATNVTEAITRLTNVLDLLEQRGCYACVIDIHLYLASLRGTRMTGDDETAIPQLLAKARAIAVDKFGADDRYVRQVDFEMASWEFSQGHVEAAHRLMAGARHPLANTQGKPLAGRVVDRDGKPVAGATVTVAEQLAGDRVSATLLSLSTDTFARIVTTDAKGELAIPDAVAKGIAIAELGDRRSRPIAVAPHVELVLEPTGKIEGRVDLHGVHPTKVWIRVMDPEVDVSIPYILYNSIEHDGRFTLAGVPRRRVRLVLGVQDDNTTSGESVEVDASTDVHDVTLAVTPPRAVHVIVRSTVGTGVDNAQVWIVKRHLAATNLREIRQHPDLAATVATQPHDVDPPRELADRLGKGDRYATIARVPAGEVSACAIGTPRVEDYTEEIGKKLEKVLDKIVVPCVPIEPGASVVIIAVPPFPRLD